MKEKGRQTNHGNSNVSFIFNFMIKHLWLSIWLMVTGRSRSGISQIRHFDWYDYSHKESGRDTGKEIGISAYEVSYEFFSRFFFETIHIICRTRMSMFFFGVNVNKFHRQIFQTRKGRRQEHISMLMLIERWDMTGHHATLYSSIRDVAFCFEQEKMNNSFQLIRHFWLINVS